MHRTALTLAACALLAACGLGTRTVERTANTVYLLPLGDSITQADRHHTSYRYPLWAALQGTGVTVDFVGSLTKHHKGKGPVVEAVNGNPFDRDHEGHWGWRADEVLEDLTDWLAHYPVDIALVHLGTNDVLQGQSLDGTLDELSAIVRLLRQHNPEVSVLLARPGQSDWPNAASLPELADGVSALSRDLTTDASPVFAVDIDQALLPEHTYDGLHPNATGEAMIADRFFEALMTNGLLARVRVSPQTD